MRIEQLYLCVPRDHAFAKYESITLAETRNETFINLPKGNSFRAFCDSMFKKAGIVCHGELECDVTLRGRLVAAGFGLAITTNTSRRQNALGDGIVYIPITDNFAKRPLAIIWNPRHYLSKAALDFKDYVMETEL